MLEEKVRSDLFGNCQVKPGQMLAVGFSGGADSLCLLKVLCGLPVKVIAVHFDHQLRPQSGREAQLCREIAGNFGCEFASGQGDVREFAAKNKLSIEEAARILRYRFISSIAMNRHADAVAVAHHADDQVETVLMHLIRGAGAGGLAGMHFRSPDPLGESPIPIIRPLLGVWRNEILQFCRENDLTPLEDPTNMDATYFRNSIRLDLVPNLQTYNPQIKQHIWQTAALLADENDALDNLAADQVSNVVRERGEHWVKVNQRVFTNLPVWLKRRVLRKILFDLKSTLRDVDYSQLENALNFLDNPLNGKTCQVEADFEIFRFDPQNVIVSRRHQPLVDLWPQIDFDLKPISVSETALEFPGGWFFTARWLENRECPVNENPWKASLDAECLPGPLSIGKRRFGESFMPFGMGGERVKLGDFFTNVHLPARARNRWPLVRSGDEVVWVPGFRIAESCRVTSRTRHLLQMELIKK